MTASNQSKKAEVTTCEMGDYFYWCSHNLAILQYTIAEQMIMIVYTNRNERQHSKFQSTAANSQKKKNYSEM